jgi:hypothetical protein
MISIVLQGSGAGRGIDGVLSNLILLLGGLLLLILLLGQLAALKWQGGRRWMMLWKDRMKVQVPVGVQLQDLLDHLGLDPVEPRGGDQLQGSVLRGRLVGKPLVNFEPLLLDERQSVLVELGGVILARHEEVLTVALPPQKEDGEVVGNQYRNPFFFTVSLSFILQRQVFIESQEPGGKHPGGDLEFFHEVFPQVEDQELLDGKNLILEGDLISQVLEVGLPTLHVKPDLLGEATHVLEGEAHGLEELDEGLVVQVRAIIENQVLSLELEGLWCPLLLLLLIIID